MKPIIIEHYSDNGEHSHFSVVDSETGKEIIKDIELQEYKDKEFCKAVDCLWSTCSGCSTDDTKCVYTAKEFHRWLKSNGYRIVKDGE